jgi:transcription termination/antitermination protein NusG
MLEYLPASQPSWYVIHTRSRHEFKVETGLQRKGLEIFLPRTIVQSRRRDRNRLLEVPLFPGYIFVQINLTLKYYHDIIKFPGVVRLLGCNGQFPSVAPEIVESIMIITTSGRYYQPHHFLKLGMQVLILEGPLSGIIGVVDRANEKKQRLVINVELLKRSVAVELKEELVEPYV